jgi:hypothetical protein
VKGNPVTYRTGSESRKITLLYKRVLPTLSTLATHNTGMDNYPDELSPGFTDGGRVETTFSEWWEKVKSSFPNVPEDVAEQWLHRHWGYSHYGFLTSSRYRFRQEKWNSHDLTNVRSGRSEWDYQETLKRGRHLWGEERELVVWMRTHSNFPTPIIIMDNRQNAMDCELGRPAGRYYPPDYIVVEGHTRHELALWMLEIGEFAPEVAIWMMIEAKGY